MKGEKLIHGMAPVLNEGEYVFVTTKSMDHMDRSDIVCEFREKEGISLIMDRRKADELELTYQSGMAWITLTIHSSLDAIGLNAVFSGELAKNNISCNVVAGYFHDHVFVPKQDGVRALEILNSLSNSYQKNQ